MLYIFSARYARFTPSLMVIDFVGLVGNLCRAAFEMRSFRSQLPPSGQAASCQPTIKNKWEIDVAVHFLRLPASQSIGRARFSDDKSPFLFQAAKIRPDWNKKRTRPVVESSNTGLVAIS